MYQIIITLDSSMDHPSVTSNTSNLSDDQKIYLEARSKANGFISSNTIYEGTKTITTHTWNSREDYENFVLENAVLTLKAGFGRDRQFDKRWQTVEIKET